MTTVSANSATSISLVDNSPVPYNFNSYLQFSNGCFDQNPVAAGVLVTTSAGSAFGVSTAPGMTAIISSTFTTSPCGANRCCVGFRAGGAQFGNTQANWNPAGVPNTGKANIYSNRADATSNHQESMINGFSTVGGAGTRQTGNYRFAIGSFPGSTYSGTIAEVVIYNRQLTPNEFLKVQSYLATKFGITLGDNTAPLDYLASDGSIFWQAGNVYQNRVTVIGRDGNSGLSQRQSRSVHPGSLVELYHGSVGSGFPAMNVNNTNTFNSDISFLAFGDNNGDTTLNICALDGEAVRMERIWKVQSTGSIGIVTLAVDPAELPPNAAYLIVSGDTTFPTAGTTIYPLQTAGGKKYASLQLSNNLYFSFSSDSLHITASITDKGCYSTNDGAVSLTVSGGLPPYSFSWSTVPPQASASATGLDAGTYSVTVSHGTGAACSVTRKFEVGVTAPSLIPGFDPIASVCVGGSAPVLPSVSKNGITGTWSPAVVNTATAGSHVYTFTPDPGQCAVGATLQVEVVTNIVPAFDSITPVCVGSSAPVLPFVSKNGVTGVWSPAVVNTATAGSHVHTFTPDPGQCAVATTLQVEVEEPVVPSFDSLASLCMGDPAVVLPSVSNDGITGSWNPPTVNTATAGSYVHTFTPDYGQCAIGATLAVEVEVKIVPAFDPIAPVCVGAPPVVLPSVSKNGIMGSWNPPAVNTATAGSHVHIFTPEPGHCTVETTLQVEVQERLVPSFDSVAPVCVGAPAPVLPPISLDGIPGVWNPPAVNNATAGNYVHTFIPDSGQCIGAATLNIIVKPALQLSIRATPSDPYIDETVRLVTHANVPDYAIVLWAPVEAFPLQHAKENDFTARGKSIVTVVGVTEEGCRDTAEVEVNFLPHGIMVPNAFTPNSDGLNDVFRVLGNLGRMEQFKLSIFNRWGQRVFYTTDKYQGWDGTFNGAPCVAGTYAYMLEYQMGNGPVLQKGSFHLLR